MSTAIKDHYRTLGVARDATDAEIKRAYRRLARQYHPDVNQGDPTAEATFKAVNEAHDVLSNAQSRRDYDEFGDNWRHADQLRASAGRFAGGARNGAGGAGSDPGYRFFSAAGSNAGSFNIADLFGFGDGFGAAAAGEQFAQAVEMPVTLEEAFHGSERVLQIRQPQGEARAIAVKIPAGIADGGKLRVRPKGLPPIDVTVRMVRHPVFARTGDDLHCDFDVPLDVPILGGSARVRTIEGSVELDVPAGTRNGKRFKLAGKGMPKRGGKGRGDLFATLKVVLPQTIDAYQRRLFESLRAARTGSGAI